VSGHPNPCTDALVRETMKGVRRALGVAPTQKKGITTGDVKAAVSGLPPGLAGHRGRLLFTIGFAGGFRRSELAGITVAGSAPRVDRGLGGGCHPGQGRRRCTARARVARLRWMPSNGSSAEALGRSRLAPPWLPSPDGRTVPSTGGRPPSPTEPGPGDSTRSDTPRGAGRGAGASPWSPTG